MTDEIDQAQEKIDIGLADAIRAARQPGPPIVATGRCLLCDEVLGDEQRWCDEYCAARWRKERGLK